MGLVFVFALRRITLAWAFRTGTGWCVAGACDWLVDELRRRA